MFKRIKSDTTLGRSRMVTSAVNCLKKLMVLIMSTACYFINDLIYNWIISVLIWQARELKLVNVMACFGYNIPNQIF